MERGVSLRSSLVSCPRYLKSQARLHKVALCQVFDNMTWYVFSFNFSHFPEKMTFSRRRLFTLAPSLSHDLILSLTGPWYSAERTGLPVPPTGKVIA